MAVDLLGEPLDQTLLAYIEKAKRAARLTDLSAIFSDIALGNSGAPKFDPQINKALLGFDRAALNYSEIRDQYISPFNRHFVASIPYILEEQCRLGAALHDYSKIKTCDAVYTLGDGAGVTARALTCLSNEKIRTLNCSPTRENLNEFNRNKPSHSHFFLGPFYELTPAVRAQVSTGAFANGFDVIIEDTTFQMYARERMEPIALTKRHLKQDGILILIEKLAQLDREEFNQRERQKDEQFKSRYFTDEDISKKRSSVLYVMDEQLATLNDISSALLRNFKFAIMTWNSGNFYTIAASDDQSNLHAFVSCLLPPAIPSEFLYYNLPLPLDLTHHKYHFRHPNI